MNNLMQVCLIIFQNLPGLTKTGCFIHYKGICSCHLKLVMKQTWVAKIFLGQIAICETSLKFEAVVTYEGSLCAKYPPDQHFVWIMIMHINRCRILKIFFCNMRLGNQPMVFCVPRFPGN